MKYKGDSEGVVLRMSRDEATQTFHDLNRIMSIIDMYAPDLGTRCHDSATQDQEAYDRLHALLELLQP